MPQWLGELIAALVLTVSLLAAAKGLVMVHPGLALAVAGLTGVTLAVAWLRRDRPFPEVSAEVEPNDSREEGPDDDGRMEVRPL